MLDLMEGLEAQREMMEDDMNNAITSRSRADSVLVQVCHIKQSI